MEEAEGFRPAEMMGWAVVGHLCGGGACLVGVERLPTTDRNDEDAQSSH